ncbi:MAG: hypothetical protein RDU41_01690 [Clostridia bacterium]|nr:hypothetical protein [Clostridia bacterium]
MRTTIDLPWHRCAMIAELAYRLHNRSPQFGKTALQKTVYLLQELHGVECGYDYSFYTYGPFSSELLSDLDFVQALRGVAVDYVGSGSRGYEISPGDENVRIREKAAGFLSEAALAVDRIVDEFGSLSAKDLELRSTLVYVDKDTKRAGESLSRDELVRLVKEIKPRFNSETIQDALADLVSKGYVQIS